MMCARLALPPTGGEILVRLPGHVYRGIVAMRLMAYGIVGSLLFCAPAFSDVDLTDAGGLTFTIITDATISSGGASEANFTGSVVATTVSGGETTIPMGDSFDPSYNAIAFSNGGDFIDYSGNGVASLGDGDRTVVMNDQNIWDMTVHREVFVPDNDEFARWITVFTNNAENLQNIAILVDNNLGSDGLTRIHTSSSGDAAVDSADEWAVTFESFGVKKSGDDKGLFGDQDPRMGHVFFGSTVEGSGVSSFVANFSDVGLPSWQYNVSMDPGETMAIMNFVTGQPNLADAVSKCEELALLLGNAMAGLSVEVRGQIVGIAPDVCLGCGGGGGAGGSSGSSSACFIATAAYGTPMAGEIDTLRTVRDTYLLQGVLGTAFVDTYYRLSPPVADVIAESSILRTGVRMLLAPVVAVSKVLLAAPYLGVLFLMALVAAVGARRRKRKMA